jgi:CMP-N-acetylneuraminic acid synthetase
MGRQWEQQLPDSLCRENGAIYWFNAEQFSLRRFYRMPPFGFYEMKEEDSLDINTMDDWKKAEEKVSVWQKIV